MSRTPIQVWLDQHDGIFGVLDSRVQVLAAAAGDAGAAAEHDPDSEAARLALEIVAAEAHNMLEAIGQAEATAAIPDADTNRHFRAALARWRDATETIVEASLRRDVPEVYRGARALHSGGDEVFRAAAALRRATGQPPDPANPFR